MVSGNCLFLVETGTSFGFWAHMLLFMYYFTAFSKVPYWNISVKELTQNSWLHFSFVFLLGNVQLWHQLNEEIVYVLGETFHEFYYFYFHWGGTLRLLANINEVPLTAYNISFELGLF